MFLVDLYMHSSVQFLLEIRVAEMNTWYGPNYTRKKTSRVPSPAAEDRRTPSSDPTAKAPKAPKQKPIDDKRQYADRICILCKDKLVDSQWQGEVPVLPVSPPSPSQEISMQPNAFHMMPPTPTIDQFLSSVHNFLRSRDAVQLRDYILVEPPLPNIYATLTTEIRQAFPPGSGEALERKCNSLLPEDLDRRPDDEVGTSWSSFVTFMRLYFEYLRDVNVANLLDTHGLLSGLTK